MPTLYAHPSLPTRPPRAIAQRRVLLADPDAGLRRSLKRDLEADGYDVVEAEDGLELIHAISGDIELSSQRGADYTSLGLIVADVHMPGFSGLEALAMLRNLEWPTPVILTTSHIDGGMDALANRLGAAAVLDKPFDIGDLRALMNYVMPRTGAA